MSSWDGWARRFSSHGFAVHVPGWPGEADSAAEDRRRPGPHRDLGLETLVAYYEAFVRALPDPPVLIGHSLGGLLVQHLIGAGLGRAAVAVAPLPVAGTLPDRIAPTPWPPASTRSTASARSADGPSLVPLPRSQFRRTVANTVGDDEAAQLFERHVVHASRRLLTDLSFDCAAAARIVVDTDNVARGPLLLVSGQEDRVVPDAATRAVYKSYGDSTAVTDLKQFADRGHSAVFDSGWPALADYVLVWLSANGITAAASRT
jgi:pimeloyl-ACP methyl ester carboxylesterase